MLEKDIKSLSRSIKKRGGDSSSRRSASPGSKKVKASAARTSRSTKGKRASSKQESKVLNVNAATMDPGQAMTGQRPARDDERFASYLSGHMMSSGPLRQEQSVQRNKAIFMIVFVLIVAFVVVRLVL